jgi:hypothetical protein
VPATMLAPQPGIGASGRPQPQTTNPPAGSGPFLRYARAASRVGYNISGQVFGGQVTNALAAAPGYLRWLDITVVASGGSGTTAAAVASSDSTASGVANILQLIQFKDPWGTPLLTGDGFSLGYLLQKYSGQGFSPLYNGNTVTQLPSYSAIASTGNFTNHLMLPVEGTKGYGVVSIGNSSVLPSLLLQLATSAAATNNVFSTTPSPTVPTLQVICDEFYYDVDPTNPVEPPGNGSTFQTSVVQGNQTVGSAASTRVQLPRTGGYLTSLILVLRDNNGTRTADTAGVGWNSTNGRIRIYIDGVPRFDETYLQAVDRMFYMFGGTPRDAGVIAYSFKSSLSQLNLGFLDTLEQALQTNPGTLIEVEMTPWGTIGAAPATLYAIITQLVPSGPIAQGLPEV